MRKKMKKIERKSLILLTMFVCSLGVFAQNITVNGTVRDSKNEPVIGASVVVQNTEGKKTVTNMDGFFELSDVKPNASLVVSYLGMQTQTVTIDGKNVVNIVLQEDTKSLGEVVVVGYGTQKKVNLTGTVNVIKPTQIVGKPVTSLANALQGTTPGVTVISRPGDVGNDMGSINVRGRGNLGTSSPLYIVDGVPVGEGEFQRIYPGDIESISILKDAAASAIYGSRAAFGVFLVTTKQGKEGKTSVSYNGYFGLQTPTILPQKLSGPDYAMLINEANTNAGKNIVYDAAAMELIKSGAKPDLYPNNDWYKLLFKSAAPMQEHNVSVSGGGKTRYYVSGTFYDQTSLIPNRNLNRYSFRTNTERDFSKIFTLGTSLSYIKDDWARQGDFSITDLDRMTPLTVAKHSDGSWGTVTGGRESGVLAENNPLRKLAEYGRANRQTSRLTGIVNATLKPITGLTINGVFSYNKFNQEEAIFDNRVPKLIGFISHNEIGGTDKPINKLTETWQTSNTIMSQLFATYTKTIGSHDFSLMAGNQYEQYQYRIISASRKEFISNELDVIDAGSTKAENLGNGGGMSERAFLSQFGRFNYAYAGKYLFEANVRIDQSSQFPKTNRLGIFPSFSAAWRLSEESFMKNLEWLSNLKLRASWGKLGNVSNVGYYDYFDLLETGTGYVTERSKQDGVWPAKVSSDKLGWETVTMTNLGLDASFFQNKFDIQLDVFDKLTSDILLLLPQPYELGLRDKDRISTNAGKVSNKGIEFTANYRNNIGDFNYQISGNISKIWNKIVDLKGLDDQIESYWIKRVGEAIGAFYGYKADGLFVDENDVKNHMKQDAQTKPGDIKYADVKQDGVFNADDRTILGNDVPYLTFGASLSASYKGFDLSVQGQGVGGVKVYLSGETSQAFFNGASGKTYHLGRWTKENPDPNAIYPRILPTADNNQNLRTSSFWLYNADYFRIKSLILGYTIPKTITQQIKIENLRLYLSATNLFTIRGDKRMKDFDPEMASARGTYPNLKVMSLGLNVTF